VWTASENSEHGAERLTAPPEAMDYLPVFIRLNGQRVVLVGGGAVALRKAQWFLKAGARLTVIAPSLTAELTAAVARGEVAHSAAAFAAGQLSGAALVVAATDDREVNSAVSRAARARGIPVNVVDDAELSSFIFPAIIDRAPVLVAVGSCGQAPVLARRVREQIEALLPARLGALARFMGRRRAAIRALLPARARRPFWERVAHGPLAAQVLRGDEASAAQTFARELNSARLTAAPAAPLGEVYLIGAGPGDPDLLTLKALQLLQQADVILYDRLANPRLLERARRDAERIFVGKESGAREQQEHINQLILSLARAGKRVARLKGGDPLVFGRGGEELALLAAHEIPCQVVPGITAALGAAAGAHLPLTQRGLASSVTFVSGHAAEGASTDWRFFADPAHTVVFYMGVARLRQIIERLRAGGAAATHPAALIEQATLPQQRVLRGSLADIEQRAQEAGIAAPALLIVGAVAALAAAQIGAATGSAPIAQASCA
jgi:uroporphyrin-III C-methyltransferase / precorrin-2 dehydrogenase / sirohydrochlorin ferrochelatase